MRADLKNNGILIIPEDDFDRDYITGVMLLNKKNDMVRFLLDDERRKTILSISNKDYKDQFEPDEDNENENEKKEKEILELAEEVIKYKGIVNTLAKERNESQEENVLLKKELKKTNSRIAELGKKLIKKEEKV